MSRYTYRVEDDARELLAALRERYGLALPEEAAGLISDYLCDAFFWGGMEGRESVERALVGVPPSSSARPASASCAGPGPRCARPRARPRAG